MNHKGLFSKQEVLNAYEDMLFIRRFEERVAKLYGEGHIGGFCHLYIGQEAVIVGIKNVLTKNDSLITSYRAHAHAIVTGTDPKAIMAELVGKSTGTSKGKGGSMHIFDIKNNFFGGHGIVGAQVPIGTGIAFAYKYKKENNICVTFFGDGAAHQGQVYESFNMAKLWDLPVLYIIENNKYAMGTSVERSSSTTQLHKRADGYNIKNNSVNGMDVFAVKQATEEAVNYIRKNQSPFVLEVETYRYKGHSMSDPGNYRTKDEIKEYKESDPLLILKNYILKENLENEQFFKKIEKQVKNLVLECVEFAKNSPEPDLKELWSNIYA